MPIRTHLCLWLLIILLVPASLGAQQLVHTRYTTDRGLPSEVLFDAIQSFDGHIWVATDNGIARFDGIRFRTYETAGLNTPSATWLKNLPDGRVIAYSFDETLIISDGDHFRPFLRELTGPIRIPSKDPTLILRNGNIALTNQLLFLILDPITEQVVFQFEIPGQNRLSFLINPVELSDGTIVLYHNGSLWFIDPISFDITRKDAESLVLNPGDTRTNIDLQLLVLNDEIAILSRLGNENFLMKYHNEVWVEHPFRAHLRDITSTIVSVTHGNNGYLFLSTLNGVTVINDQPQGITSDLLFENIPVNKFIRDNEGGYWASTNNNGLFYIRNLYSRFWSTGDTSMPDGSLNKLSARGGYLYAGNALGYVGRLDIRSGRWRWFDSDGRRFTESVFATRDGRHVLTGAGGLRRINLSSGAVSVLFNASYKSIAQFENGDILVAVNSFAAIISATKPAFLPVEASDYLALPDLESGTLTEYRLRQVRSSTVWIEEEPATFWVNYQDNLYRYEGASSEIIQYEGQPINATAFERTQDGTIWIGSRFGGLYAYHPDRSMQVFMESDGLLSNRVTALVAHGDSLWVGTNRGIQLITSPFSPNLTLSAASGLASSEVNDLLLIDNDLYISGSNGLQIIPIESIVRSMVAPAVFIQNIA